MTINSTTRTAGPFNCNGLTKVFPFAFKVFTREDLLVATTDRASNVETILTLDSDFTVTLNADQNVSPGGVITMTVAPPAGVTLAATSNIPNLQKTDLTNQGGFYPRVISDALDKITIQIQQLGAKVGLGLNVGASAAVETVLNFIGVLASIVGASKIGFVQAGAGSVPRTVQDKLREASVSIADKGGSLASLDNSAALFKAVTDGRSVYIPDGEWKVSNGTALPDGAYIWGPGTLYRTNAGPIFTAIGKTGITVNDIGLKGDLNSYALEFYGCRKVRVSGTHCTEIMLVQTSSTPNDYTPTVDANMSDDVVVVRNTGDCQGVPNAVSQQFIRILYSRNVSVCDNSAFGYRDLILIWGGDFATFGSTANLRKCYNVLVSGNRGRTLSAGIWTAMASDVLITGNQVIAIGAAGGEGLDSEGSDNVSFIGNHAHGYSVGCAMFGINRNLVFKDNDIAATAYAFRNANNVFFAGYGQVTFDGNIFSGMIAGCVGGTIGSAGRVKFTNNTCYNVAMVMSDASIAELIFTGNRVHYDYVPAGLWLLRVGSLAIGYTDKPKRPRLIIRDNLFEWRGGGIMAKRAIGLTSSDVDHLVDVRGNEFAGIDEQISYEGTIGGMYALIKNNVFDINATYPSVLHGSSANMVVIWQDNMRSDGLDAYGSNTAPSLAASFFSETSRIWSNTPTNGGVPGWVRRAVATWGPMAANG